MQADIKAWHLRAEEGLIVPLETWETGRLLFADTGRCLEAAAGGIEDELKPVDVSSKAGGFSHQELAAA